MSAGCSDLAVRLYFPNMELAEAIKTHTLQLGFDAVGITTAEPLDSMLPEYFRRWLAEGGADGLEYMKRHIQTRFAPAQLLEGAQSVICAAVHYKPADISFALGCAQIARFALYDDYHLFIREQLQQLACFIESCLPKGTRWTYKICTDSVPLAERALAARAGLGFIGKNHMLIHPVLGCQILLGELVTTLPLPPDGPALSDGCGGCTRCLQACPAGALRPDGFFQTNRCISFLTQYAGDAAHLRTGRWIFGCDECLLVCPYEQKAPPCRTPPPGFTPQRAALRPEDILQWNSSDFERFFKNSCVERIGLKKLQQNAAACLKSSDKPTGNTR
ncbi:MAG TPA: tRNA epoxyqueuosine(34) reductase QueG [Anaerohalosphaeraceae bacterium]|nr:tRNA epoxyqueuosine(34) reductase QueG [Anaerohalosphaeraceae bacterium]